MTALTLRSSSISRVASELGANGFVVTENAVAPNLLSALQREARLLWEEEDYRPARVGSSDAVRLASAVRSDRIRWIDDAAPSEPQAQYLEFLEELRHSINRETFIGLFEWEGHYACYPEGAFYRRHLDVFADARQRQVSTILYLNEDWQPGDGGELRIWTEPSGPDWSPDSPSVVVEPRAGTLVTFLSEDYFHEVQAAHKPRFSLTGWFRTR